MTVAAAREPKAGTLLRPGLPTSFKREGTVYAIAFDMDIEQPRVHYGDPYNAADLDIRRVLERHGFQWQQGRVYFGGPAVTAVGVTVAVVELSTQPPWVRGGGAGHPHAADRGAERPHAAGAAGGRPDRR